MSRTKGTEDEIFYGLDKQKILSETENKILRREKKMFKLDSSFKVQRVFGCVKKQISTSGY